jgi:hypothetical protein
MQFNFPTRNKKQILIISVILAVFLFFIVIYGVFLKKEVQNNETSDVVETQMTLPLKFSRITFFHTTKPICSLAIPEAWEGKYRMNDSGSEVHFLYIQDSNQAELFYIKKYKKNDKIDELIERKIFETKNNIYVTNLLTRDVDKSEKGEEFEKMIKDRDGVLENFRCF